MTENVIENLLRRLPDVTGITSQTELAKSLKINRSSITHARNNNKIPEKWILKLYRKFNLNPEWIEFGIGKTYINKGSFSDIEFTHVPMVKATLSAGGGSFNVDANIDGYLSFTSKWLRLKGSVAAMVAMEVAGDSMEPEIRDRDTVLIDRSQTEVKNRKIYAVGLDDTIFIKRLEQHPGSLVFSSDNKAYAPIYLKEDELRKVRILGKVIWISREYR